MARVCEEKLTKLSEFTKSPSLVKNLTSPTIVSFIFCFSPGKSPGNKAQQWFRFSLVSNDEYCEPIHHGLCHLSHCFPINCSMEGSRHQGIRESPRIVSVSMPSPTLPQLSYTLLRSLPFVLLTFRFYFRYDPWKEHPTLAQTSNVIS